MRPSEGRGYKALSATCYVVSDQSDAVASYWERQPHVAASRIRAKGICWLRSSDCNGRNIARSPATARSPSILGSPQHPSDDVLSAAGEHARSLLRDCCRAALAVLGADLAADCQVDPHSRPLWPTVLRHLGRPQARRSSALDTCRWNPWGPARRPSRSAPPARRPATEHGTALPWEHPPSGWLMCPELVDVRGCVGCAFCSAPEGETMAPSSPEGGSVPR